jgi:23S rRNA (cytidine1920-2'-O)/16S rRNA (cytidine1409-2'-O)-methyltransferase
MKKRLDLILVEREMADTRTKAQALIMAGEVSGEGRILDKPGQNFDETIELHLKTQPRFVSRAGEKLASVAEGFGIDFTGLTVLDVGSSTGGFTDYALQNGAVKVYCVDVGTGQLSYKLRQNERVVVMEQTDIRKAELPELCDIAVMDVSFISLEKVLEPTAALLKPRALMIAMAKPQFEAGRELATKYAGVIPMGDERDEVIEGLRSWILERFDIVTEADSGLAGAEGNVEHFFKLAIR